MLQLNKNKRKLKSKEVNIQGYSAYIVLKKKSLDNGEITCTRNRDSVEIHEDEILLIATLEDELITRRVVTCSQDEIAYNAFKSIDVVLHNSNSITECFKRLGEIVGMEFISNYSEKVQNTLETLSEKPNVEFFTKIRISDDTDICMLHTYIIDGEVKVRKLSQEKVINATEFTIEPCSVIAIKSDNFVTVLAGTYKGVYIYRFFDGLVDNVENVVLSRLKRCNMLKLNK